MIYICKHYDVPTLQCKKSKESGSNKNLTCYSNGYCDYPFEWILDKEKTCKGYEADFNDK